MDQGPLVKEEIDAGAEFIREFDKDRPVKAAFWLKTSDDYRYLFVASDEITDATIREAYGQVSRLARPLQSVYFDAFRVKLISASNPLARAAVEFQERFPKLLPTRLGGTMFGGTFVEDVYLYAPLEPASVS